MFLMCQGLQKESFLWHSEEKIGIKNKRLGNNNNIVLSRFARKEVNAHGFNRSAEELQLFQRVH
jgi:hypothetical protein